MSVDFVQREFFKNKLSLIVFSLKETPVDLPAEIQPLVAKMQATDDPQTCMIELQDAFWEIPGEDQRQQILDTMVSVIETIEAKQKSDQESQFSEGFNFFDD